MSRIGKQPVVLPEKVKAHIEGQKITVEGPKGKMSMTIHDRIKARMQDNCVLVERGSDLRQDRALHGLTRSLINNMARGVHSGFQKVLEIHGVGFKAILQGNVLNLSLGKSHPINYTVPQGITITIQDSTVLTIQGVDKQLVGAVAADIIAFYPVEPYKGKGVRERGKSFIRKEGKTAQSK